MKSLKKIFSVALCLMLIGSMFAGCSSSGTEAKSITEDTMLIAYTGENKPFIYEDKDGNLTGFDVQLMKAIFEQVKGDYKNYKFVKVDEGYKVGEDAAYTDKAGNEYIADVMIGGIRMNYGTNNEDYSFTNSIITDKVIAIAYPGTGYTNFAKLKGAKAGVVSTTAKEALNNNSAIKKALKSVKEYKSFKTAYADLKKQKIDIIIVDEFEYNTSKVDIDTDFYSVFDQPLDTINYCFALKKNDGTKDTYNEAIRELKSKEYNDKDEFTPIVKKYFGYNASNFEYEAVED